MGTMRGRRESCSYHTCWSIGAHLDQLCRVVQGWQEFLDATPSAADAHWQGVEEEGFLHQLSDQAKDDLRGGGLPRHAGVDLAHDSAHCQQKEPVALQPSDTEACDGTGIMSATSLANFKA